MINHGISIFAGLVSKNERLVISENTVLAYPVLFWAELWPHLLGYIERLPVSLQHRPRSLFELIREIAQRIYSSGNYPRGIGPLDEIHQQFLQKEITETVAIELARLPHCYNTLSPHYINTRCDEQYVFQGRSREVLIQQFSSLERMSWSTGEIKIPIVANDDFIFMISRPVIFSIKMAVPILTEIPDGSILKRCQVLLGRMEKNSFHSPKNSYCTELYYSMGLLYLDSYFSGRELSNIDRLYKRWIKRFYDQPGVTVFTQHEMPDCKEACQHALFYLRKALAVAPEKHKQTINLALDNAMYCEKVLSSSFSQHGISKNYENELGKSKQEIYKTLKRYQSGNFLIEGTPEALIAKFGQQSLFVIYHNEMMTHQYSFPIISYTIFRKALTVLEAYPDEMLQEQIFENTSRILYEMALPLVKERVNEHTAVLYAELSYSVTSKEIDLFDFLISSIVIAISSVDKDQAQTGIDVFELIIGIIQQAKKYSELMSLSLFFETKSLIHNATALKNGGKMAEALDLFEKVLYRSLENGYTRNFKPSLANMQEIADQANTVIYFNAVSKFISIRGIFAQRGIVHMDVLLNKTFHILLRRVESFPQSSNLFSLLFLMIKGFDFRQLQNTPSEYSIAEDKAAIKMLGNINSLFIQSSLKFSSFRHKKLNKEDFINAFITKSEMVPGHDEFARFSNLQIEFDHYIQQQQLKGLGFQLYQPTSDETQALLDNETIFINQLLGETTKGEAALYSYILTKESLALFISKYDNLSSYFDSQTDGEARISSHSVALMTSTLREEVVSDPPDGSNISINGEILTKEMSNMLFSEPVRDHLTKLHEYGKNKLCVWPHSALHYVPYHLLPYKTGLMADEWNIRIVPDITLLSHKNTIPVAERTISIMAMSFTVGANPLNLPALPEAIVASEKLAKLFHTDAITDVNLTKSVFLHGLQHSKWVHIYTHGYLTPSAPSFQNLFFYPKGSDEGIFYAYEIIGLDLRHIDLLTLSACESGLGRFDELDNLHGLAANLLVAGVSTIIGSLWEAESTSSAFFFQVLYEALDRGEDKQSAFRTAQMHTRTFFPEYRDWGAFYYLGS